MTLQQEIDVLVNAKHTLIRKFDFKEVDEKTYKEEIKRIQDELDSKNKLMIEQLSNKTVNQKDKEEEKMAEKVVEEEKPKKIGKKVREDSYASVIATVLGRKTIKTIDATVDKVLEIKPGHDRLKIKAMVKTIIREAKVGKGRWKNYTWKQDEFLLEPKE